MRKALHRVPYRMIGLVAAWTIAALILVGGLILSSPQLERAVLLSPAVRAATPLTVEQALANHAEVRAYLLGSATSVPGSTIAEVHHLHDVKRLVEVLVGIAVLCVTIGVSILRYVPDTPYRTIARRVSIAVLATVLVLAGLALVTGFQNFFLEFHLIFFPQGNFTFPASSFLITTYPEAFFSRMALSAGALVAALALVTLGLTRARQA